MSTEDHLERMFQNEAVAVYKILSPVEGMEGMRRYVISSSDTRDLINFPEIMNRRFVEKMARGLTYGLIGLDHIEKLSSISSKTVNVYHILRGGLNFGLVDALRKAYGYKWHSSSFVSSQRILMNGHYEVEEDKYRKFVVPQNATIYTGDIVASGASLARALRYLKNFLVKHHISLHNCIFFTIGGEEAERVLREWHRECEASFSEYRRTLVIYVEGRFGTATEETPYPVVTPWTDLLRSYQQGSLHAPEFEFSQFEKMIIALEACVIYDGGKKSFEPTNHLLEIREYWLSQQARAKENGTSLWGEYNLRFPLAHYLDPEGKGAGSPERLSQMKSIFWKGLEEREYVRLFAKFRWLWSDERIERGKELGSFAEVCEKKLKFLDSYLRDMCDLDGVPLADAWGSSKE